MATRSRIGIELSDGSILSSYSHWDGYPEWMGRILRTHYNTKEKVADLIDGGDMSSPWTDGHCDDNTDGSYGPEYYSQRGDNCPPRLDADLCVYLLPDGAEEYHYLFTQKNEWICYNLNKFENKLPEVVEIPNGALMV